jgi:nucleoid DNA-binding protein
MKAIPPRRLVDAVSGSLGVAKSVVNDVLVAAFEAIKEESAAKDVMIRGFGTFYTATRAGCVRPSPSDVERTITIPTTRRLALRSPADRLLETGDAP